MNNREMNNRKLIVIFTSLGFAFVIMTFAVYLYRTEQQLESQVRATVTEGINQFRQKQYEQSLQTLSNIPEDEIKDWHIPYYLGSAMIQLKEYDSSIPQLEKAFAMNPADENIPFALGVAHYKLGNLSLSKAYFAAVLELNPGNEEAKGLMDIMANLERIQPGARPEEKAPNSDDGNNNH